MIGKPGTLVRPDARPLYAQVKDILVKQINSGAWKPGELLPSEFELADELGVSQGTVRKALDALADLSLVERKQGRGTFVAQHTSDQVLFKFFQIYDTNGDRVLPGIGPFKLELRQAKSDVARSLAISEGEGIYEINRVRTHGDRPMMVEKIILPLRYFPSLHERKELPNTLYDMFQSDYGITISHVQEDSTAVLANKTQARHLNTEPGHPLLKTDRLAFDIADKPVERRISYCLTDKFKYRARLR